MRARECATAKATRRNRNGASAANLDSARPRRPKPGYEQKSFPEAEKRGKFRLIAGPDGKDGSVTIHQDAKLYVSLLEAGEEVKHELGKGRYAWLQVAKAQSS